MPRHIEDVTDDEFQALQVEAAQCRQSIMNEGGMAAKSTVEVMLMKRHDLTKMAAHTIMNCLEQNDHLLRLGDPLPLSAFPELDSLYDIIFKIKRWKERQEGRQFNALMTINLDKGRDSSAWNYKTVTGA